MLGAGYEVTEEGAGIRIQKLNLRQMMALIATQLDTDYSIPLTGAATLPDLRPEFFPQNNATLGSCLLTILGWAPIYIVRSDNGALQIVNVETSALRTIDPAALAAPGSAVGLPSFRIRPRYDILCSQTSITYQRKYRNRILAGMTDTASTANGSPHVVEITVPLEDGEPYPDEGLADQYQRWVGKLKLDCEINLIGDPFWSYQVGERVVLDDPAPRWGTDYTVIQTIARNLATDEVTLTCGARNHLSLDQLLDYNRKPAMPPNNDGGANSPALGLITTVINGIPGHTDRATWSVGGTGGVGDDSVELPPGTYSVVFNPVYFDGRFFFAASASVEVTSGGNETATAEYEEAFFSEPHPWKPVRVDDTSFKVTPSTIGGHVPPGMEPGSDYVISGGAGKLYGVYNFSTSTGDYISVELVQNSGDLDSEDGILRMPILQWTTEGDVIVPVSLRTTPINVSGPCLVWFTNPKQFSRDIS
jgi:hypothetical protein